MDPDIPQAKMSRENLVPHKLLSNDKQLCNKAIVQDQINYQINYVQTMYVHNNQQQQIQENQQAFTRSQNFQTPKKQCPATVANQQQQQLANQQQASQVANQPQQVAKQHANISA